MFLEPAFSRTVRLAQYNGVREAARRLHDDYIGTGNVFHLFRLPEEIELDLQTLVIQAAEDWFRSVENRDSALNALRSLVAEEEISITEGPCCLGSIKQFYDPSGAKVLAHHYLAAFKGGFHSFPYFTY